jgi:hypothetical protein
VSSGAQPEVKRKRGRPPKAKPLFMAARMHTDGVTSNAAGAPTGTLEAHYLYLFLASSIFIL